LSGANGLPIGRRTSAGVRESRLKMLFHIRDQQQLERAAVMSMGRDSS
jgi:hypothetical protein